MSKLSDRLVSGIGKFYLDVVEKLPTYNEFVGDIQSIRHSQRKDSEQTHVESRPPAKSSIDYLGIWMFEVFEIEDSSKMLKALWGLLPPLKYQWYRPDFRSEIEAQVSSLFSRSYQRIGTVFRDAKHKGFLSPARQLSHLPEEVDYIEIWLHHILPSLFVVSFNVVLSDLARQRLEQIQREKHLSEIRFRQIIPLTKRGFGYTKIPSETITKQKVSAWNEMLRSRIEKSLGAVTRGYFGKVKSNKIARLPSVEIYQVHGVPGTRKFSAWFQNVKLWLESMNLLNIGYTYSDDTMLFLLPDVQVRKSEEAVNKLIVLSEPYLRKRKASTERLKRANG